MKHDLIRKLAGMTAAATMAVTATGAMADTAESAIVKGGSLNLRETASLTARVLGQYPTGTLVEITESGDEWHKVEVNGKTGYMMAKYLNSSEGAVSATVHTNTGIGLNVREEPEMDGRILTSVKNGASVTVTQRGNAWCRVNAGGVEGFMATQYLRFGSSAKPEAAVGQVALVSNPRDTQVLNLRKSASLDAKVLSYYRNGAKVTILKPGSVWHKVQTQDGKIGYMMAKYLTVTSDKTEMAPFQAKLINVNGGSYVNFRKGASLSAGVISRVPVGSTVTVLEHGTDWCKVSVDGQTGYISTWFMSW